MVLLIKNFFWGIVFALAVDYEILDTNLSSPLSDLTGRVSWGEISLCKRIVFNRKLEQRNCFSYLQGF